MQTYKKSLLILSMNGRQYGMSSQISPKILSQNLQQSLHLPPHPATLTFPPLTTTLSPLLPALPTPTTILTPQTTYTTPTPSHQPQPLSPLSHSLYSQNNHIWKDKNPCSQHIRTLYHNHLSHHLHHDLCSYHLHQEITFQKNKTIHPGHSPKETRPHTQSVYFNWYLTKTSQKISSTIHTQH